jgi:diaminohydroxyphosphoribosylaminopyrimidine deaminase/5-amino-6-(5-phosphoribosylamino)uracil reductase
VVDDDFMARALALAERGRGRTSPNPMVGAIVVDAEGVVVGRGFHEAAGTPHAEIHALRDAGERARGATLYCTLEPCSHTGRTGPCAPRVVDAGIRRAVIAGEDPNPLVAGRGLSLLREHGIEIVTGVRQREAEALNTAFFLRMRQSRPLVTMKVALTLDGCVSFAPGERSRLTGAAADRLVHRERAEVDAIAIGSGTVLADDPLLTPRGAYRFRPLLRVIFDRRLRTPPDARLLSTLAAGPVIIFSTTGAVQSSPERVAALTRRGAQVEALSVADGLSAPFLSSALRRLAALECGSIVLEGGPVLHRAFWCARFVDRVQLFVTPHHAGGNGSRWDVLPVGTTAALHDRVIHPIGTDTLIQGYVHGSHRSGGHYLDGRPHRRR